jgi:hypothetical protein
MIMTARGSLSTPPIFSYNPSCRLTLPPHLLEPSMVDLLRRISTLDHCYVAFSVQPPSWSLLHEAFIENNHQTSIRDFCSTSLSWTIVEKPSPVGPSSRTFVEKLSPARPSSRTFIEKPFSAFVAGPLWSGLRHRPPPTKPSMPTFSSSAFVADLRHRPPLIEPSSQTSSHRTSLVGLLSETFSHRPSPRPRFLS